MTQYNYEILSLYTAPSESGLTNVVKRVTWRYQATDGAVSADIYKDTYLDQPQQGSFVEYTGLTDTTVFGWVSTSEDINKIKEEVDAKLQTAKAPLIVEREIPWDRSFAYTGREQYVITNNDAVVFGPSTWNSATFNTAVNQLGLDSPLPVDMLAYKHGLVPTTAPLQLNNAVKVYQVGGVTNSTVFEDSFFKDESVAWDFASGKAVGTYQVTSKSIDAIKASLKNKLRNRNDALESATINVTSGGVDFPVYPTSWGRLFILTKLHRLQDGQTCSWWNNAIKIQVTKDQLNDMLVAVDDFIESLYEYEIPKIVEINNCTTIAELSAIVV